ncbi:MAG: ABC transporter permease subunit, partial [Propionicimonas sp.]|nr:ABC transporter permease subunit [Propionicimonas sp.]
WLWIYNDLYGVLNYLLTSIGLIDENITWMSSASTSLPAVCFMITWKMAGFNMLMLLSALQGIDDDVYEASSIDGASGPQRFFRITLPLIRQHIGLALIISGKSSISIKNPGYSWIANGTIIPGIPNAVLVFILLAILAALLLNKTLLGRYALAIGSNEEATRLSGVNVKLWKLLVYVVAGVFVALGAILYSGRFGFVQPAEGVGFELNVIAAVVIGGTSLAGGRANILGTVVGALIMETLKKGLLMMGIAQEWQFVVTGIVVIIAVFVDNVRRKRANTV